MPYDKKRLEAYVDLWFVGRLTGRTLTDLLGIQQCSDSCVLYPDRWELVEGFHGKYYRCRQCQRFVGYPAISKSRRVTP